MYSAGASQVSVAWRTLPLISAVLKLSLERSRQMVQSCPTKPCYRVVWLIKRASVGTNAGEQEF